MALVLGLDDSAFWRLVQSNACIDRFALRDGRYTVSALNETCHLRGEYSAAQ
jgi:hypothetical protein